MTGVVVVLCTCADDNEAGRIAQAVVEESLAACVNILPGIESVYRWEGKVERSRETLLIIKTVAESFDALRERISALHSYDIPELIALPVELGLEKYLAWIRREVKKSGDEFRIGSDQTDSE
ncbi:MAG: divalent-cation tolerance protein CutA [Acidobacteriaceae bacterium]|nr:divalent-cation tolerance protein CutA [Acidobacteriaceae bacterium]